MSKFTLFWLDGTRDLIEGNDRADAFRRAGIGQGALPALDFFSDGVDDSYEWKDKKWQKK